MMAAVRRFCGQQRGSVVNTAGTFVPFTLVSLHKLTHRCLHSELAEPQKLLPFILQPEISNLSPDIIAVYIQAATKIFGHWAAETAQRWSDEDLPEVKNLVEVIIGRVSEFVSNPHIEVQERVSHYYGMHDHITLCVSP